MKIKKSTERNFLLKAFLAFLAKHKLSVLFFVTYNLVVLAILLAIGWMVASPIKRTMILQKAKSWTNVKYLANITGNYKEGLTAKPETLTIDISHKNLQKIGYVRSVSLQQGLLYETDMNEVPAVISHNGRSYRVELSLKGRMYDHWNRKDHWSFKVRVKDQQTIMGMRTFALQHPRTRSYMSEWIVHRLFGDAGIINLRYDFVSVDINGMGSHIYALEETFDKRLIENNQLKEGPIFKFNRDHYWDMGAHIDCYASWFGFAQEFWSSDIVPTPKKQIRIANEDINMLNLFNKVKTLMEAYRNNELVTSEVFDHKKLAMFFALEELTGSHHSASLDNIRFYYNPITSKVEPIIHDNDHLDYLESVGMLGEEKLVGQQIDHRAPTNTWIRTAWLESVFKDSIFFKEYIQALEIISEPAYLDNFFTENGEDYNRKMKVLHSEYTEYEFKEKDMLYANQRYIKSALEPTRLVHAYINREGAGGRQLRLDLTNNTSFPVEVLGIRLAAEGLLYPLSEPVLLQSTAGATPIEAKTIDFAVPAVMDQPGAGVAVVSRILGASRIVEDALVPGVIVEDDIFKGPLAGMAANVRAFDFIKIDDKWKKIIFQSGTHTIDEPVILPAGYEIMASAGTRIDLTNHAFLLSYSPFYFIGSEDQPITIWSSDGTGQGLLLVNARDTSTLQYVAMDKLKDSAGQDWSTSAVLTFYRSPVNLLNCFFGNNDRGRAYLELIRSPFSIDQSIFSNSKETALIARRSTGRVSNTQFRNSGKDAIALEESRIDMENLLIDGAGESGIKAKRKSTVEGTTVEIYKTDIALDIQDYSMLVMNNIGMGDSRVGYAAAPAGPVVGPSIIRILENSTIHGGVEIPYSIDAGSFMRIGEETIETNETTDD